MHILFCSQIHTPLAHPYHSTVYPPSQAKFIEKDFIAAAERNGEAIKYSEEVETAAGKELTVTLILNQAMAYVKSAAAAATNSGGHNKNAIASATRAIEQPEHAAKGAVVKAYYWRAMAHFNLNEYGKCKKDCVAAAKIDNGNKSVRKLHKKATKAAKSSKAQIKKLYKGVFDKVHFALSYLLVSRMCICKRTYIRVYTEASGE